jgi:hypothetical protein
LANDNRPAISEWLLASTVLELESVIRILKRKGILTEDEIVNELNLSKKEVDVKVKKN